MRVFSSWARAWQRLSAFQTLTHAASHLSPRALRIFAFIIISYHLHLQYSGQRYFRSIRALVEGLGLKPDDVVYFGKVDGRTRVEVGVWRAGSDTAKEFANALQESYKGTKRGAA